MRRRISKLVDYFLDHMLSLFVLFSMLVMIVGAYNYVGTNERIRQCVTNNGMAQTDVNGVFAGCTYLPPGVTIVPAR